MNSNQHLYTRSDFQCLSNIERQTNDLYLIDCGHHCCPPGHSFDHKIPIAYHLHFIINGKGTISINNQRYPLAANDIFIIPKGLHVDYMADQASPWEYAWVVFDGTMAVRYLKNIGLSTKDISIHSKLPTQVYYELIQKILSASALTITNEIKRVCYLFEIMATLMEAQNPDGDRHHDYSEQTYVEHALQFISHHYKHTKVSDIADYIGINRSYLTTIFKKELRMTPQAYLIQYKMGLAAKQLRTTDLSIIEIAAQLGYENPLNFSKSFKKHYQVSPTHYRLNKEN